MTTLRDPSLHSSVPSNRASAKGAGCRWYFTGVECVSGHLDFRLTSSGDCLTCARERLKRRRGANAETFQLKRRAYDLANAENRRERDRIWREGVRAQLNASQRARRAAEPEKNKQQCRAWHENNRDLARARGKLWRISNRPKMVIYAQNRRARKQGAEGFHTVEDISALRQIQGDACVACKIDLNGKGQVDHIISLMKGGSNWPRNLQILCAPCNQSKSTRDNDEFMRSRVSMKEASP